ncbi:MAG TPA: TonB-dependent receptor [Thermoanaerobaculia bacterium]|nr:TonB-dependent receptor [Thermoanaerobaculia bacterium]
MRSSSRVMVSVQALFLLGILPLLFAAPRLAAAEETGVLAGTVKDPTGGALPGVTVEASSGPSGKSRVTDTGRDGSYRLENLPPASYRVVFRLGTAASLVKGAVSVASGHETRLDVTLALSRKTAVDIVGRRSLKDLAAVGDYAENLVGIADAATEGTVTQERLESRPLERPADLLEATPGLVVSQHSGEGKANQYYLRGFNLDHGTDFATYLAGVPVNMPTHAHGQGYTDINFLLPELVTSLQYRKGPYYADEGDFSAVGSSHINYARSLLEGTVSATLGSFGYARLFAADSFRLGGGDLLAAGEFFHSDGPWDTPNDYRRYNAVLGWSRGDSRNGFQLLALAYAGTWDSTDQIPLRAVDEGLISRWGAIDPTDGGKTSRYSLSGQWQRSTDSSVTSATAYVLSYSLNLWNNFTYFLDDPVSGDQFEQEDRRVVTGARFSQGWLGTVGGFPMENTVGFQLRNDNITNVGLYKDVARVRISTTRQDHVTQTSGSLYVQNSTTWTSFLRSVVGLRGDRYRFRVASDNPLNSGTDTAGLLSPKLTLVFGPFSKTEIYLNGGSGFHSNDGRGSTITVSPVTGEPAERVSPLVRALGAEIGVRSAVVPHLELTGSLWLLNLDSELVFSGDAGETEPSRASRRHGVELGAVWTPIPGLTADADLSFSKAQFHPADPEIGNEIPGALENVVSAGAAYQPSQGLFGSLRVRYFGPRPLIEDGSVWSKASTLWSLRAGYQFGKRWQLSAEVFNLFNAKVSDIDYYYTSRLPGEPAGGVDDIHFHPAEPFSVRLTTTYSF